MPEQIQIALGPQRATELESMLRVENVMNMARGAVQGNSTTARQLFEMGLAGGAGSPWRAATRSVIRLPRFMVLWCGALCAMAAAWR